MHVGVPWDDLGTKNRRESKYFVDRSRQLIETAKAHVEAALPTAGTSAEHPTSLLAAARAARAGATAGGFHRRLGRDTPRATWPTRFVPPDETETASP